jgi:hypothetical protein
MGFLYEKQLNTQSARTYTQPSIHTQLHETFLALSHNRKKRILRRPFQKFCVWWQHCAVRHVIDLKLRVWCQWLYCCYHTRALSLCPFVRLCQTDFDEIWYRELSLQCVEYRQILLKSGKSIGHFTWRPKYVYFIVAGDKNSSSKHCCATLNNFTQLTVTHKSKIRTEHIVACPLQQWLSESATLLRYTYTAYFIGSLHSLY